jgi:hypothetical protein
MSTTQQVQFTSGDAINAYLTAHGTVVESIAAFDAVVTDPEWKKVVVGLSADEADFLLGEEKGRGYYVVLFAKAMALPADGATLWDLDGTVREAFIKNAEATKTIIGDYLTLTAEGNLPKWATRESLLRKLSLVGKPEPKKTESSVLVERHVNTFLKDVRLGVLTVDQMTTVLNALQAVVSK